MERYLELSEPSSTEHFTQTMEALCRDVGMQHYLVARLRGVELEHVLQVLHNTASDSQVQGLRHWSLVRMVDHMRDTRIPAIFGAGAAPAPELPGFGSGVASMAAEERGAVLVYFGHSAPALAADQVMPLMRSTMLAAQFSHPGLAKLHAVACPLSERELECLRMAFVEEQSSKDIARDLNISARTVEHYLEIARAKLGADSTIGAGCEAVRQGWVSLKHVAVGR